MTVPIQLPPLTLNLLTAAPLLRLLLALQGHDADDLDPKVTWNAFKEFGRWTADTPGDVLSFQATWTPADTVEAPDPPFFYCTISRELTPDEDDLTAIRSVQIQWSFDVPENEVEEIEVWSDAFSDLDSFFEHVEESDAFRALAVYGSLGEFYTVDSDDQG